MAAASPTRVRDKTRLDEFAPSVPALTLTEIVGFCLPYLSIRDCAVLKACSKTLASVAAHHSPEHLAIVKSVLHGSGPSVRVFETYGTCLLSLALHRVPFADKAALSQVLALTPHLRRLSIHDADWTNWDDEAAAASIASLKQLQELRLQCNDSTSGERNPFASVARRIAELPALRKLTLFSRLDGASLDALVGFLNDHAASRRLMKLKVSTGLLASPGGSEILAAVSRHVGLQKLTIVRPDGMGEPLRKPQCQQLATAMHRNKHLRALHLRRCGLWTDSLSALVPAGPCPNLERLKLDGNSLGYLSGAYFNEAMDTLLSRLPNLQNLHLGNNQLDAKQAEGLAASFTRHKMMRLENLTLGSNDIGDAGLAAIIKALPPGLRQLYLHGIDATDAGVQVLAEGFSAGKFNNLWGLGLNGNPITDTGARTLARAIRGRDRLKDIGITLSEMTDAGVGRLATALATCPNLRYVYLYTAGFKASTKVTDEAKAKLREALPVYATAAFDHRLSRYLKKE